MEGKSIYQKLDREVSNESKHIASLVDEFGTNDEKFAIVCLIGLGWKTECFELVDGKWKEEHIV